MRWRTIVAAGTFPTTLDPSWLSADVTLILGFAYITASSATWEALFDDVTFDAR